MVAAMDLSRQLVTVKIRQGNKIAIEQAKEHPRETFDDVLTRLLRKAQAGQTARTTATTPNEPSDPVSGNEQAS